MTDEDYYQRKQRKSEEMQAYVLACIFLAGLMALGAIVWRALT